MKQGTVVSIGTFDGVHLGHQAILREVRRQAKRHALPSLIYAFRVPPRWALQGGEAGYLLLPKETRLNVLRSSADVVHPAAFESVRFMEPKQFIETVLIQQLKARIVVEGASFRFGRNRRGDLEMLNSLGSEMGLTVISVPPVLVKHEAVSSTRIRLAIQSGDLETAQQCLGRCPILLGTVIRNDSNGDGLGIAIAELFIDPHVLLPLAGVYLVHALGKTQRSAGVLYVGFHHGSEHDAPHCKLHLFDVPTRVLDDAGAVEIHLLRLIREHRTFPSSDALHAQMMLDASSARSLLPNYPMIEKRISS